MSCVKIANERTYICMAYIGLNAIFNRLDNNDDDGNACSGTYTHALYTCSMYNNIWA